MKKLIGKLMLFIFGWNFKNSYSLKEFDKSVLICAPHTSNWDFYYCLAVFFILNIPYKIMIKDSYTKPWYGFIFKAMGCIGVNRSQKNNLVQYTANLIKDSNSMVLVNTPEGTRSWAEKWKKGFYYIAKEANVPIVLAYADYKNKVVGIGEIINIKNKTEEDIFKEIEGFYKPEMAKYSKLFNPKIY